MALLEIKNVSKHFAGLVAVGELDFSVAEGSIAALIGPNGAGKTTVFNMITGAYTVTSGDILFDGKSICGQKPHVIAQRGIARTFQNIRLFKKATVLQNVITGYHGTSRENMFNIVFLRGKTIKEEQTLREKAMDILRFLKLEDIWDFEARNIPYGRQRLLEIGRALAMSPKLLLLDEPAAGMNSAEKKELVKTIREIRDAFHVTVLLVEHDMELVMDLAENITVLNYGRKIASGTPAQVQMNETVIEAYLGRKAK